MVAICSVTNNLVSKCWMWVICNLLSVSEYTPNYFFLLADFYGDLGVEALSVSCHVGGLSTTQGEGTELIHSPPPQPHSVFWSPGGKLLWRLLAEDAGRRDFRLFICLLDEFPDSPPHRWYQRGDIMGPWRQRGQLSSPIRASPQEGC